MAHLPFLFCDDRIFDDQFVTTEFAATQFCGDRICDDQRTGLLPDAGDPARKLPETAIGRSDGEGIIARCDDERNDL
jgi:hypothetical protein